MNIKDKILIRLYFPLFKSASSSRFEELFTTLSKSNSNKYNKKSIMSNLIHPERIIRGEDKRTSLLIKNIPKNIKKKEIRSMVEKFANINFFGIKQDKNTKNFIKAYLNVINYRSVVPIYMGLRKNTFNYNNKIIFIKLHYSKIQGKEELIKVFNAKRNELKGNLI